MIYQNPLYTQLYVYNIIYIYIIHIYIYLYHIIIHHNPLKNPQNQLRGELAGGPKGHRRNEAEGEHGARGPQDLALEIFRIFFSICFLGFFGLGKFWKDWMDMMDMCCFFFFGWNVIGWIEERTFWIPWTFSHGIFCLGGIDEVSKRSFLHPSYVQKGRMLAVGISAEEHARENQEPCLWGHGKWSIPGVKIFDSGYQQ